MSRPLLWTQRDALKSINKTNNSSVVSYDSTAFLSPDSAASVDNRPADMIYYHSYRKQKGGDCMAARTRTLCVVGMCTALLCVGAWIAVPASPPFTLQTLVLFGICLLFPGKKAIVAVLLYLLLAAVGLPVLSGFGGGIGAFLGPTGGYLFGFLLLALCSLLPCRRDGSRLLVLVLGLILCYACGTAWYAAFYTELTPSGLLGATLTCVVPFVLPDTLKLFAAWACVKPLKKSLSRRFTA